MSKAEKKEVPLIKGFGSRQRKGDGVFVGIARTQCGFPLPAEGESKEHVRTAVTSMAKVVEGYKQFKRDQFNKARRDKRAGATA